MATPAPPVSTPGSSRTRDWVRNGESGAAFSGLGRGGRGGGRGRNRGRGRGGPPGGANSSRAPSTTTEKPNDSSTSKSSSGPAPAPAPKPPAAAGSAQAPAQNTSTTSGPAQKPSATPAPQKPSTPAANPGRQKGPSSKPSRSAVPALVVAPSIAAAEVPASASASRPANRRRRSQQLSKGAGNAAGLKVNVPPLDDNFLRPQNSRLGVPHTAPLPSKDAPPHLAGSSFDMRNNIDALVERVRAVAMDHRPSTPGSHIDWAGDEDEGLPDLDDWGVTTSVGDAASVVDKDEMISPIIVDGLKPLPEPVAKPPTPSNDLKEEIAAPFVMEQPLKPPPPSLHPSLPAKPVAGPIITASHSGRGNNRKSPVRLVPAVQLPSGDGTEQGRHLKEKLDDGSSDSGREGLAASIHAPSHSDSFTPSNSSTPPPQTRHLNATHNRSQTVGRVFPQSAPVNFNPRFSRSGTSTPRGGNMSAGQHARTHSSPPAGSVLHNNHRPPHTRPVITGDAISRLARTIARTPPISASNI
ncbi:proline/serine-rich protein [Mycena sanguinolenta]|nr:proline/serine-rich protein [Mycena sanguinolenta]